MGIKMAGHSKWSSIKRKKKINDDKRGKLFSKLTNEIKMLAQTNVNVESNFKLKNAIARALNKNINKSIIENIIQKKNNDKQKSLYIFILPNDFIIILECLEFNNKSTISKLKHLFSNFSGKLTSYEKIETLFYKFIGINILDNYNEEKIIYHLSNIVIFNFLDNKILSLEENIEFIIYELKKLNLKIEHQVNFVAKKMIIVDNIYLNKLSELKKKITEQITVFNIFTNISGL